MYIKPVFWDNLLFFLLKGREEEAKFFVEERLTLHSTKVEKRFYQLVKGNLDFLNRIFDEFKTNFKYYLNSAPPPFSIFLLKEPKEILKAPFFRAGKIYFSPGIKKEVEDLLKKINFFYKVETWFKNYELIFPATVDQKLLLPFKDVFWTGSQKPCFFCGSTLHAHTNCPGLKILEPGKAFIDIISHNFNELGELLWEEVRKGFTGEKDFFSPRYFYFLPNFLKVIFFKSHEISSWSGFKVDAPSPVRGGDLGLGLDFLIRGELDKAKVHFDSAEEGPLGNLGLFFVNLFKKTYDVALYYLESVIEEVKNRFVKSYAYLLKGRLHEVLGDTITAEEMFREAIKVDNTCLPARFHFQLIKYGEGGEFRDLSKLLDHTHCMYWLFLDPFLIKDQKELEELLFDKISEKRELAVQRLKEAEDKFFDVKDILKENKRKEYEAKLKELHKKIYQGGIGAIEKASELALELSLELQGLFFSRIKELNSALEEMKNMYEKFRNFWNKYPYKTLEPYFGTKLKELAHIIESINKKLMSSKRNKMLKLVIKEIETGEKLIKELSELEGELRKKWIFRKRLYYFLRSFSILESILLSLYIALKYFSETGSELLNPFSFIVVSFIVMIFCLINAYFKGSS